MLETAFTRLVGCRVPIQSVPAPGIASAEFVAAVCRAGGLGMLSATLATPDTLAADLDHLEAEAHGPFGVNFLAPFIDPDDGLIDLAAARARVVDFFYGEPDPALADRVHAAGALCSWQVGSCREAQAAEAAGCDFVIVQGHEAGGHVRGTAALLPVLSASLRAVQVPVLAAGGLATGRDVAAVLAAGAAGCRLGTRLVCTAEANAHDRYKQLLLDAGAEDTVYTNAFHVLWPDAPHRVLRSAVEALAACEDDVIGECEVGGRRWPVARASAMAPTRSATGRIEAMALYAGQSVGNIRDLGTVAAVMESLLDEAAACLSSRS